MISTYHCIILQVHVFVTLTIENLHEWWPWVYPVGDKPLNTENGIFELVWELGLCGTFFSKRSSCCSQNLAVMDMPYDQEQSSRIQKKEKKKKDFRTLNLRNLLYFLKWKNKQGKQTAITDYHNVVIVQGYFWCLTVNYVGPTDQAPPYIPLSSFIPL